MPAPALVLLAHGSRDPKVVAVTHAMRKDMQECRPSLDVHIAFIDHCPPTGPQVVGQLARRGVQEVVFVPLEIGSAQHAGAEALAAVEKARLSHPGVKMIASRPIGPEACLLGLVDRRLREALARKHVEQLDALVLSTAGVDEVRSRSLLARRGRQWAANHRLPVVVAHATGAGPNVVEAVQHLRGQGRRHVAVGSWFLTGDETWHTQAMQAIGAGAVSVSAPLGGGPEVREIAMNRYVVAAMDLLPIGEDEPAESAAG
ncbi:MAG: hypothetical protein GXX86_05850 [Propionibacterium sp.]|nr:hypothetical protein [Propionibacterium sp.]